MNGESSGSSEVGYTVGDILHSVSHRKAERRITGQSPAISQAANASPIRDNAIRINVSIIDQD
jgi:hypothetical protein